MLYSMDTGKYVTSVPHQEDFDRWMSNLSADDYQKIEEALNEKIDRNEINNAAWLPGNDWTGTVFEPIYDACGKDATQSGRFFGLIVFHLLMNREDKVWGFGRFKKDGKPIGGITYFVIKDPPVRQ